MTNLEKSITLLKEGEYTCVLCGGTVVTSTKRGVSPLVALYEDSVSYVGYSASDRVVGKGAAFLYVLLGVKEVYALVISKPALDLLTSYGVSVTYDTLVPNIINRQGDGICPFEEVSLPIQDPRAAYQAIRAKMAQLNIAV